MILSGVMKQQIFSEAVKEMTPCTEVTTTIL